MDYETPEEIYAEEIAPDDSGAIMSYDPTYKSMDIDKVETELRNASSKVIKECTEVFFKTGEIDKPAYVTAIQELETMNLESMVKQVKISQHMIDSLVRRLNDSGTTDLQLFRLIMDAQNHALSLTLNVSNYIRNLPGFFKGLRFELEPALPELTPGNPEEQRQLLGDEPGDPNELLINRPQMGTKDLLKIIDEAEKLSRESIEQNDNGVNYSPAQVKPIVEEQEKPKTAIEELLDENEASKPKLEKPTQSLD